MRLFIALLSVPPLISAKLCSLDIPRPQPCDIDQWHQERRTTLGPDAALNIRCWDRGRSVTGETRWFYLGDRRCWIPLQALGMECDVGVPHC
ncbi:hypothetical protein BCR34DRAFT_577199 [Clohesyomyces aquaticus]|uniref:Ig-like domain-containing protein n=1 Tax=Clohesyomyces aquaticus TaxID=1231657 RepID=A0A1Y1YKI0_9PLEO|nr:hypothetical protein BCR34DRAFT_577199 [Clohesyomyces aquaticus]